MASMSNSLQKNELFNNALQKMNIISISYQQGKIKYPAYMEQMDALIEASGWSREAFQAEVDARQKIIFQK